MRSNIVQNSGCYPYGLPISGGGNTQYTPYLFGNKEFEDRQGLNIYDFGARTYVPDECRFWQPDPKAHDYHWLSPYAYCGGDPINRVDPDGCKVRIFNNKAGAIYNIAQIAATNMGNIVLRRLINSNNIYTLTGVYFSRSSEFSIVLVRTMLS